jgi:hypothetical protein
MKKQGDKHSWRLHSSHPMREGEPERVEFEYIPELPPKKNNGTLNSR